MTSPTTDICIDSVGNIYIITGYTTVTKVDPIGGVTSNYVTGLTFSSGICADTFGNLYITDGTSSVTKVDSVGIGIPNFVTGLNNPQSLTIDSTGNLYINCNASTVDKVVTIHDDIFTPVANVAIGALDPSDTRLYVSGNAYISGDLTASNVFGSLTGNIVGSSNLFGDLGVEGNVSTSAYFIGDGSLLTGIGATSQWSNVNPSSFDIFTPIANVAIGALSPSDTRLYVSGNAYVSSALQASNIYGTLTGNIVGNSNLFGDLGVKGNVFASNIYGSLRGNIIGDTNLYGNLSATGFFIGNGSKLTNISVTATNNTWSNVVTGGSALDIYTPIANVAIGSTNASNTRLYVSGNVFVTGNSNVVGNMGLATGDIFTSNVIVGSLTVTGNLFTSNVFGSHTGNIVGNSSVFGNLGLTAGDTSISNVIIGDMAFIGNVFASNVVGTRFGPVNTSNVFGSLTGNIVGNSNVLGILGLLTGDTSVSNVLIGDLTVSGNLLASNVFGSLTGNLVGNSSVLGNLGLLTGDTSISNVLVGDLTVSGNLFTSNVFGSHTGNIVGNSSVLGNLGLTTGDTSISNVIIGDMAFIGNVFASNIVGNRFGPVNTSNVFGSLTGNIVGNSNVLGNLGLVTGDTSVSNVMIGDLTVSGNLFTSNVFGSLTGNIVGNSSVLGNLGLTSGDTYISNVIVGDLVISGNLAIGGSFSFYGIPATVGGALSDETTTLTTSNKISIRAPFPFSIRPGTVPLFMLNQLPTVTTPCIFDIGVGAAGTSIYSTRPQITSASTSNVSATSGTPGTLTGTISVPQYSIITANVFQVGSGTPTGAKFVIYCS